MNAEHPFRDSLLKLRDHLHDDILPLWLDHATDSSGLFLPRLDRRWRRLDSSFGTIVSQSRLLFSFARGHALTGDTRYREQVKAGADFMLSRFRDNDHGGWFWACAPDGSVVDRAKSCYGHAFALFGLSHAYGVLEAGTLQDAARHTWEILDTRFRDRHGGFVAALSADLREATTERSQNPIMHLFEALLAAATVGGMPEMLSHAESVGRFVVERLLRPDGGLPEVYDTQWQPLPESRGGRIDIGHAFEWAFLLSEAVAAGLPREWLSAATKLLRYGLDNGFDGDSGGIVSPAPLQGRWTERRLGWWEQCEATRALVRFVTCHDAPEHIERFLSVMAFIDSACIDQQFRGWYSAPTPAPGSPGEHKGSEWKLDYHVVGLCTEAIAALDRIA
ncbi:MAG: hypothetical protein GF331_17045 [Chitinivibrionales bacterium]|nr:hypothetical protein [Chitinivibrionales bacterium]